MVTFVNIQLYSYTQKKEICEPKQRAVLHTAEDLPNRESLNEHIDNIMEDYEIDNYSFIYEHEANEPCVVATFMIGEDSCCVRITPCICKEAAAY